MAFIPAPGVAEFVARYSSYGNEQLNVHHVKHVDGSSWNATQLQAMNSLIANWDLANLASLRVTDFTLQQVTGRDLSTQNGAESSFGASVAGGDAGGAMPENVTFALKKVTGLSGRSFRGRLYHIGIARTHVTADTVNSTYAASLVTAYDALLTAVAGVANCKYCILRSQSGGAPLSPRLGQEVISFTVTDYFVDSQRRRLAGHNIHH
jgi:hypothetical protein